MTPIKPGTARRLGLRPCRPRMVLTVSRKLSESEYEELRDRWLKATREDTQRIHASLPSAGAKPYLMPALERAMRTRRRVWPYRWFS